MVGPLAQSSTNPLLIAAVFTAVSMPIGLVIGYFLGFRYKILYMRAARELANLKGENFRGELSRIGVPQGQAPRAVSLPSGAEKLAEARQVEQELRAALAERTAERDQLAADLRELREELERAAAPAPAANPPAGGADPHGHAAEGGNGSTTAPSTSVTGTEAWQLAQLHREQIAMQLRLDEYRQQVQQLIEQRDQWQRQASTAANDFEQLRQLLAEQEALIASVERERDSLATRLSELE